MLSNGLYYSPTWEPTIPAGEYMFSAAPEETEGTMAENIGFTSNNTSYSRITVKPSGNSGGTDQ